MTLGASTFADAMGGWAKGCLVLLTGVWLLLALLGVRSGRFPRRLAGGAAFIVGSSLWIGMHGSFAESLSLDAGEIGWWAKSGIADRFGGSFALSGLGALLLICSVLGLLVAIDWLPLLPFAPLLLKLRDTPRGGRAAGAMTAAAGAVAAPVSDALLRARAAATLEREPPASRAPAEPEVAVADAVVAEDVEDVEDVEDEEVAEDETPVASAAPIQEVSDPSDRSGPDWARFRPRATVPDEAETSVDLPVDNAAAATHNPGFNPTEEGQDDAFASAPSSEPEGKDPPVFERETLAPRRKKESEEPDEPKKEDEDEDKEEKEGEEGEDEDWEEEGEEGEEGDEWEEDDKDEEEEEEEEEETEEEEEEEWDEDEEDDEDEKDEDEDEKDEDEDWEEDDEEEKDEDKDDKDDDENWEEDKDSSNRTEPQAAQDVTVESALVAPAPVEPAPVQQDDPEVGEEPSAEVEFLGSSEEDESEGAEASEAPAAPEVTETTESTETSASSETSEPVLLELPARLFSDLPEDERQLVARGVEAVLGLESVSLSRLQRELGVTYYSAARVFERLEKEGFIAPYTGSLAREVRVTRPEWEERRKSS